jgi:septum formation protein
MSKILLASKSPRRLELLSMLGYEVEVAVSSVNESGITASSPALLTERLATLKAEDVYQRLSPADLPVVAADTVVELNGQVLGKPRDEADARAMLHGMSGTSHLVHTGLAVIRNGILRTYVETATVHFRPLTAEEIEAYIASGQPFDKAGAYGIQGPAGAFVEGIEGDFFTIVGLPLCRLTMLLRELGG